MNTYPTRWHQFLNRWMAAILRTATIEQQRRDLAHEVAVLKDELETERGKLTRLKSMLAEYESARTPNMARYLKPEDPTDGRRR